MVRGCVTNLDKYDYTGAHRVAIFVKSTEVANFDSFGVKNISREIEKFIGHKDIKANIYRMKVYVSATCGYFCKRRFNIKLNNKSLKDLIIFIT